MSEAANIGRAEPSWKIYLPFWCSRVGVRMAAIGFFTFFLMPGPRIVYIALLAAGIHLVIGSAVFALIAIRCPGCRARALLDLEHKNNLPDKFRRDFSHDPFGIIIFWQKIIIGWHIFSQIFRLPKLSKCPLCDEDRGGAPQTYKIWAVKQTGQIWKVYLAISIFVAGVWMAIIPLPSLTESAPFSFFNWALLLIGFHLMIASFIFLAITVRCPSCRAHWLWGNMLSGGPADQIGLPTNLLTFSECPQCGKESSPDKRVRDRLSP